MNIYTCHFFDEGYIRYKTQNEKIYFFLINNGVRVLCIEDINNIRPLINN